jgi:hypothetical protein
MSRVGLGSNFWFELPCSDPVGDLPCVQRERLRILLAEDSEFHRLLAQRYLADTSWCWPETAMKLSSNGHITDLST